VGAGLRKGCVDPSLALRMTVFHDAVR